MEPIKKLTPEEIQALRQAAEKERATHAEVMSRLRLVTISPELQMATIESSYERKRFDEIMALLQTYSSGNKENELSSRVKLFIYDHKDLKEARDYMLQNCYLGYEVAKRIIDDKLPPFIPVKKSDSVTSHIYPKFCGGAEAYMVKETLKACQKADKLTNELVFLNTYTEKYSLAEEGDTALMDFLFVNTGRDSVLDALESSVITYIGHHGTLSVAAQLQLIRSGCHKAIMYFIMYTPCGIQNAKVVDALIERADPEEVTAYFARWGRKWTV